MFRVNRPAVGMMWSFVVPMTVCLVKIVESQTDPFSDTTEPALTTNSTSPVLPSSPVLPGTPVFFSVTPVKGPVEGASTLTVNLSCPAELYPTTVLIGQMSIAVSAYESVGNFVTVKVQTPIADPSVVGIPQNVSLVFNALYTVWTTFNFTYYRHPIIATIWPQQYIYTGGIRLTVTGTGLDIALVPVLEVTTVSQLALTYGAQQNAAIYRSSCRDVTYFKMTCILPSPSIPSQIKNYLDKVNDSTSLNSRGYVDDGNGNTMFVYVGFLFDGNVKYRNLTSQLGRNGSVVFIPGPAMTLQANKSIVSRGNNSQQLALGLRMNIGCSVEDYAVYLEGEPCTVVGLSDTAVSFLLPSTKNLPLDPTDYQFTCASGDYHLQVAIGYRTYDYQCVEALSVCTSTACKNGASCIDNWSTFVCNCSQKFYGKYCELSFPLVDDIFPNHGPVAGGTPVTIKATIPDENFSVFGVRLGENFLEPEQQNDEFFVVRTPAVQDATSVPIDVVFHWFDSVNQTFYTLHTGQSFDYGSNPLVRDIYPLGHVSTGGTKLTVNGTDLDSAAQPSINITVVAISASSSDIETTIISSYTSRCTVQSDSGMICLFPALDIPPLFLALLDSRPYTPSAIYGEPVGPVLNPVKCPRYQQKSGLVAKRIAFVVEFQFDGLKMTYADDVIEVYPPPNICFNGSLLTYDGGEMGIAGEHLLRGLTDDDYSVQIENVNCTITSLNDDSLWFSPTVATEPDRSFFAKLWQCPPDYPYHVVVTVAGMTQYSVGCVTYSVDILATNKCNLPEYQCNRRGTCVGGLTENTRCQCYRPFYGSHCEYVAPVLRSVQPNHGTLSGGTVVTINGTIPSRISPVSALFGEWSTAIITYSDNNTIVLTSPVALRAATNLDLNVTVQVTFNDTSQWQVAAPFIYNANPNITGVHPRDHVVTGGTVITITGSGLDISMSPILTITIIRRQPVTGHTAPYLESVVSSPTSNCSVVSSYQVRCLMPYIEVPQEFIPLLNTVAADPSLALDRRRRRRASSVVDAVARSKNKNKRSIFLLRKFRQMKRSLKRSDKRRRDLSLVETSGSSMTVYVLLRFDWLTVNASNFSPNVTLLLHNPPTVEIPDSVIPFYMHDGQIIEIRGTHMMLGCNWTADASVTVGGLPCQIMDYTDSRVHVVPPDVTNGMQSLQATNLTDSICTLSGDTSPSLNLSSVYPLELHVGFGVYSAGCLRYVSAASEDARQRLNVFVVMFHVVVTAVVTFVFSR